jgi:hypothetical protein
MAVFEIDAYSPRQVAAQVQAVGVVKARLPLLAMFMLGVCAGDSSAWAGSIRCSCSLTRRYRLPRAGCSGASPSRCGWKTGSE